MLEARDLRLDSSWFVDCFIGKTETKLEKRNSVKAERQYVVFGSR